MFKDKGPNYTLGFGIPQSNNPLDTDQDGRTREGLQPTGGVIARALYTHPVAKFFAVSAATMIGTAVGSAMIRRGGVRLGEHLADKELPHLSKQFTGLNQQWRKTQKLFDEWEGVRSDLGNDPANPIKRSGFFQNYEHRIKLQDDDLEDDNNRWMFRDEMQQRLIRQARSLPYQLPALYVANRAANTLVGNQNTPVNWKNPFDVIGDFAQSSIHQVAGLVAPVELGHGAIKQGWRRLMTDGDFVSNTSTFSPHLKSYGVGLKISLDKLGQDSVDLIHQATRRSGQVAGSFSNALNVAVEARKPIGVDLFNHDPEHTLFRVKRAKLVADALHQTGMMSKDGNKGAIEQAIPTLSGFARGFGRSWVQHEDDYKNLEAARKGQTSYLWRGSSKAVDLDRIRTSSYITQLDTSIGVAKSKYVKDQRDSAYKSLLQEELAKRISLGQTAGSVVENANKTAAQLVRHIEVDQPFRRDPGDTSARAEMVNRVKFGTTRIDDTFENPWEDTFISRVGALGVPKHGASIVNALPESLQAADRRFLDPEYREQLNTRVNKSFEDIRQRIIIPEARRQLGEPKLAYGQFGADATKPAQELLVRKTAEHLGIPLREGNTTHSTAVLRDRLKNLGIDVTSPYQMRGILLDKGAMSAPWSKDGFNFFGLRPLTITAANAQNYFGNRGPGVNKLFKEMGELDHPYSRDLVNRSVGRYVWESRTGKIIDLNPTIQGLAKASQVISRHVEIPFLHFSPLDLTSFNKLNDLAQGPTIRIASARNTNFGPVSTQLSDKDYNAHVWLRDSAGIRGRGHIFGYREGSPVGRATGSYYAPSTMDNGTWGRNMRIALGNKGVFNPDSLNPGKKNALRRFFRQDIEQPSSIPNLLRRTLRGEFGERYLGRPPDVENPAVMARMILNDQVPDLRDFTTKWAKGTRNLEAHVNKFHLPPSVISGIEDVNPELSARLKIPNRNGESISVSSIRNPHDLFDLTKDLFSTDLDKADSLIDQGKLDRDQRGVLKAAQGFVNKVFLENSTAENLGNPASRAVSTAGINTRADELKASIYRYIISRESIFAGDDTSTILQDILSSVDELSRKGYITGAQKVEARAAVMSMQLNIDGLAFGFKNDIARSQAQLRGLGRSPAGEGLSHLVNYDTSLLHHRRYFGAEEKVSRFFLQRFGTSKQDIEGFRYNPYGGGQETTFVPTFETSLFEHPVRSAKSAIGLTTWSDPEAFSAIGVRTGHLATRLNRYFAMGGVGVNETSYKGPLGLVAGGFIGRRVLPLAIGSALFFGIDREVGGLVHGKDQYGNRQYTPLLSGAIATTMAHGIVLISGITGGPDAYREKKAQYFGDEDVPIRKGRYWPLGNQPWQGNRIQYYRPNWYKRFMSGYQYTDQTFGSPAERLAYDYDFSPLHYVDPYHFERKTADERPYPVTGDLFTGPWGPLNTVLNATVGKVIKPHKLMHEDAFNEAMNANYERVGQYGMVHTGMESPYPKVLNRTPSGGASIFAPTPTGYYLGNELPAGESEALGGYTKPYNQPYGFVGQPYGTSPEEALESYRGGATGSGKGVPRAVFGPGDADTIYTSGGPVSLKEAKGSRSSYKRVLMARGRSFDPRVIPAADPLNPGNLNVEAGQFGYDAQEMAGIYGFGLGTARQMAGLGSPSYTPTHPVLQQASRAYGSERSFWDLNLGGLGDFPTPLRGEYGNIEFSEIARRFIPHRRRDINELNPIPNQIASKYPWLPGSDYFINFNEGDPYIAVPEGEMRLPGAGYELTHQLHPDSTGQYGLLDKHRILGDVAPWSEEYKSIDRIVRKSNLSPEDKAFAQVTRKHVAGVKKRHNFKPYSYAKSDFQTKDVQVVGFKPGEADELITDAGVIQLAGIRARKGPDAQAIAESLIHAGDTVSIKFDANAPFKYNSPIDASVQAANGQNLGQTLLNANQAYMSKKNTALNNRIQKGPISFYLHALLERAQHANTIVNQKFVPNRSAVEEWERYHVYGTDFPQWTHPIQDFIEPLGQRARNRNPIYAGTVLSFVGRAFGRTPQGKTAGSIIGAGTGAYLSLTSNAKTLETGSRYIPPKREKELAIDEYTDVLKYVKYSHLYNIERQKAIDEENSDPEKYAARVENGKYKKNQFTNLGPHTLAALQYRKEMKQTEYGADLFGDVMSESAALPKRKRDYFIPFLNSPSNDHARILSTSPRLERRMYEARWGMPIEDRPDLSDYFSQHELPGSGWEGWSPDIDLDDVRIKMIQQQGIEASQMGYYPQQVQEANLMNPSYPDFNQMQSHNEAAAQLRNLMRNSGISGDVVLRRTSQPGTTVNLQMGVQ